MYYLGIEIGGSKLQLGIGRGDGQFLAFRRRNVVLAHGPAGIRTQISELVPELLKEARLESGALRGIGIGFGGPVDDRTQTIIKSHQVPDWAGYPLSTWVSNTCGLPAILGNDADVAGLAESYIGAGRGHAGVFYITVGSGIGGGHILNGRIQRGSGLGAAEIGHLRLATVTDAGVEHLPLEQLASGWAIENLARRRIREEGGLTAVRQRAGGDPNRVTCQLLAEAARQGDSEARELLLTALGHLAEAICHVVALLCPSVIVIGGGVSLMGEDQFFLPLRQLVRERVFEPFANCFGIVPANLGETVVVHGAILLARQGLGE